MQIITFKKLQSEDINEFVSLISIFREAFEMDESLVIPDTDYLTRLLERKDFIVLAALYENQVVGGLTGYSLQQYYSIKPLMFIYDVAVSQKHQRQGVGRELIRFLKDYCCANGFAEAFVDADVEDDHAVCFYRTTTPSREMPVIQFTY